MTMPDKISAWVTVQNGNYIAGQWDTIKVSDFKTYTRDPSALDEALRDYAMFGMFVATFDFLPYAFIEFQVNWRHGEYWPEFVTFVKKEMGL